ncbi:MAG: hypothetical protein J7502_00395 [Flavisolibacter sp.]|nr:hypothetical protein [Flavisolibacter sp.]
MKKTLIVLATIFLTACGGNENAENQPTDLDRTKNNDTSAVPADSVNTLHTDSTDTTRLKK